MWEANIAGVFSTASSDLGSGGDGSRRKRKKVCCCLLLSLCAPEWERGRESGEDRLGNGIATCQCKALQAMLWWSLNTV